MLKYYQITDFIEYDPRKGVGPMKKKISWKPLFLGVMLFALMGTPLYGGGDDEPNLNSEGMDDVDLIITPLTSTDVEIDQDVEFEVTVRNTSGDPRVFWIWFTVRFPAEIYEKIVSAPYLNRGSPFSGMIPGDSEAVFQLSVRPLNELQVGFYTFTRESGSIRFPVRSRPGKRVRQLHRLCIGNREE